MTSDSHIEDPDEGGPCPLGARSAHPCGGPTDEWGVPMWGRVPGIDDLPGCGVHVGEVLVTRDPESWVGLLFEEPVGNTDPDREQRAAVAEFAEHLALDVADQRAADAADPDAVVLRPASTAELTRAVTYALGTVGAGRRGTGARVGPGRSGGVAAAVERTCDHPYQDRPYHASSGRAS
ncbi:MULTISPECIES: hypothetical protein [unclassified Embleya]|uniref:hypothetical protein n=1 Tax=unclassified Embleya TaxID=2699296 RepID=UPI0036A5D0D3